MKRPLSPGEQPRNAAVSWWRIGLLLLIAAPVAWLALTRHPPIRELRLHLLQDRPEVHLDWASVNGQWPEQDVRRALQGAPVRCHRDSVGPPGTTSRCSVDLSRLNGVPTLYANFWFADGRLHQAATALPWWSHRRGLRQLLGAYGPPAAAQKQAVAGVRLLGWPLADGAALIYNREPDRNPLVSNSVQWTSSRACSGAHCLR